MKLIGTLLFLSFILSSCYVGKTILYQTAGIYDYKIFANREVKTSNIKDSIPLSSKYNKKDYPALLLQELMQLKTTAYLVIKNDSLVYEHYWNDGGRDVLSNSFSMAKSLVGLLIGFAIQDGYIKSVEDYVCEYLPDFISGCQKHLRIRDLLTMSSELNWDESYYNPFGKTTKAYYGRNIHKQMIKLKINNKPGFIFNYQSANTQILGLLLEKVTGKKISDYLSEKLWQPIQAEHNALWSLDRKNGTEKAYCCFNATARDFAKIGLFMLHQGKWKGKQILNEEYIKQSVSPASNLTDKNGNFVDFYGYQWWILHYKNMTIPMACGLYGQYIIIIPDKNLVVVRLGHKTSKHYKGHFNTDVYNYIDAALSITES